DVGDEAHLRSAVPGAERLDHDARAERGAADAEREDVREGLAGRALPQPIAHRVGKYAHTLAIALDLGKHAGALDHDVLLTAQRRVQRRAVLGRIHLRPGREALDRGRPATL